MVVVVALVTSAVAVVLAVVVAMLAAAVTMVAGQHWQWWKFRFDLNMFIYSC